MDKLLLEMYRNGKDINEVLAMPYHFVLSILAEQNKPDTSVGSLLRAFGGAR